MDQNLRASIQTSTVLLFYDRDDANNYKSIDNNVCDCLC